MSFFECCHICKAPKRYPGCHSKCPEYKEQKAKWEAYRELQRAKDAEYVPPAKTDYLNKPVWYSKKR